MKTFLLSLAGAFTALFLFILVAFFAAAAMFNSGPEDPEDIILSMDLRYGLADQPQRGFDAFFGSSSLVETLLALETAEEDERVHGLVIRGPQGAISSAAAEELEAALRELRAAGKFVIFHSQGTFGSGSVASARLMSAASTSIIQPGTELAAPGISFETEFLKDAFDRFGVTPQIYAFHEYKNAPNTYNESALTEPHREALAALGESLWTDAIAVIALGRSLDATVVREALQSSPLAAERALELGLIDQLGYPEDAMVLAKERADTGDADIVDIAAYRAAQPAARADRIAVVGGSGPIVTGGGGSFLEPVAFASDPVARDLLAAAEDDRVRAIVFRVDSPGGSPTASDQIHNAIKTIQEKHEKPVVVSMGTVAASGGYYVSAGADRILANRATITGSIGIYGGKIAFEDALNSVGVNTEQVNVGGPMAGAYGIAPFTEVQEARVRETIGDGYDRFIALVAEGRGMSVEEVDDVARGRVWSGAQAEELGLVDETGGLIQAVAVAQSLIAGEDDDEDAESLRVAIYPEPQTGFEAIAGFGESGSEAAAGLAALARAGNSAELARALAALEEARALQRGEARARMLPVQER